MSACRPLIGIDLGGTTVKGLAVAGDGRVLAEESRPTADDGAAGWLDGVRQVFATLQRRCPEAGQVGLCAPGLTASDGRSIAFMPGRLQGLEGLSWSEVFARPTAVINDAHAALLGEVWQGAGRGAEHALMLTLGTGVGGAAMVDGRLLRGHLGRAGHLGHLSLDPAGAPDIVGTPGSLEDAIGDCTVPARSGGRFASTQALIAAASAGDPEAQAVWEKSVRSLAAGLAGLINAFDPAIVIIGGGIASAGEALFAPLQRYLDAFEWRPAGTRVAIVPAQLGRHAGAVGAARHAALSFLDS